MTWQVLETEPAYGICDQCKQHTCGITEDGKHKWIMTGIADQYGDYAVFGYKCVEAWAANLGISKEVVVKEVRKQPTEQEIMDYLRRMCERDGEEPPSVEEMREAKREVDAAERKPVKRKNA